MKARLTLDFIQSKLVPLLQPGCKTVEELKQKMTAYIGDTEITDADGNPVQFESVILQPMGAQTDAEDEPEMDPEPNAEPNAEPDPEDEEAKILRAVEAAVTKAMSKAMSNVKPERKTIITVEPTAKKFTGRTKNFRGEIDGKSPQERAYRFGMFCLAARGNENAKAWCESHGIKLHQSNVNSAGGFLVPEEFGQDLIDLREQYGVFRQHAKVRKMTSDTRTDPRRTGGLTAYFVAEGAAGTESTKAWDQVRLVAKDIMVISRYTNQVSEDAVIDIGDDLAGEITYAFTLKEDQCGFNGDGTSTYGGIVGVRSKLLAINGVDDGGGLVLASGNLWSEITLADLHRVIGRLPQYPGMQPKWFCHNAFYAGVLQSLVMAAGGVTATEIINGVSTPKILGYPVVISQVFDSAQANSQICCLFGDLSMAASFGDRQQDSIAFSDSATVGGENVFERNEMAIRGVERFDINVHDVGDAINAGPIVGLITAAA